jgi:hypothetical protein
MSMNKTCPISNLEITLRMSGHIPLLPSNYTPGTPIYQQNFGDWSRLLLEIGAYLVVANQRLRAAKLKGSRVARGDAGPPR